MDHESYIYDNSFFKLVIVSDRKKIYGTTYLLSCIKFLSTDTKEYHDFAIGLHL